MASKSCGRPSDDPPGLSVLLDTREIKCSANLDDWDDIGADWDDVIQVIPCHWDDIIPMDGGWLPHWDESLDESIGINAAYLTYLKLSSKIQSISPN